MPPVSSTNANPTATIPSVVTCRRMLNRLFASRKLGERMLKPMISSTSTSTIPSP
jgi:hypothetical protein